ncbi:MAG: cyclic nucleotide-binding domain-containing protein, partial [Gammaproteobacteria bacterium]|nr:cyclic nucleotide-binding domain-containing protein [Gammaproteobacteria bacterium]
PEALTIAINSIDSSSSRVRAIAAYTLLQSQNTNQRDALKIWRDLLNGDKYDQLSSLLLLPLKNHVDNILFTELSGQIQESIQSLLTDENLSLVARTLKQLPDDLALIDQTVILNCVQLLSNEADPELRIYTAYGLRFLDDVTRYNIAYNLLSDSHVAVRSKTISMFDLIGRDYEQAIHQWLIRGKSSPRVQSIILENVIKEELLSHDILSSIALNRACDANNYGISRKVIENSKREQSPDDSLLLLVLGERQIQLIDLALQALTPLCAEDQIAVIRAGLVSKHNQHIANACEILNNIENQPATEIIKLQLDNRTATNLESHAKVKLFDKNDVLLWASNLADHWVSDIANVVRGNTMVENNSRNLIERIALLKQTDIFSEVPTEDLLFVAKELDEIKFFNGERVFDINDSGDRMYFIVNGKIGISISPDPSSMEFIVTLTSGSSFGEMNLLDNMPRSATAHVLEDTFLLTLEKNKLLGLLRSYPDLALGILRALSFKVRENHDRNNELKRSMAIND